MVDCYIYLTRYQLSLADWQVMFVSLFVCKKVKQYIPVNKFSVRSGRFQGYLAEYKEACSRTQHSAFNEDYFAPVFCFMYC